MLIEENSYIPVDDAIERFENHLYSHERVILSAKFGDGKSFFLDKFKEKCQRENSLPFEFITLYPVNYQVLDNKDIFELIKHDVLLQMLQLDMIDVNYQVTDSMAFAFYLQHNYTSVVASVFSMLSLIGVVPSTAQGLFRCFKSVKWLKDLKNKVDKFKQETDQSAFLDNYLAKFEKDSVYENDIITKIIRDNISTYQKNHNKKIVLVIEDMDRLDPAHLFRIMNVFSAHMDYGYRCMRTVGDTLFDNKFGVNNVVFVMHEKNTEALFHHFYGEFADYDGYMSKFYNKNIFHFSLSEEKEKYALSLIMDKTNLNEKVVNEFFSKNFFASKTMRKILYSMDKVDEQLFSLEVKPGIKVNSQLLRLIIIAKRLGVDNEHISSIIVKHFKSRDEFYVCRLLPLLARNSKTKIVDKVFINTIDFGLCFMEYDKIDSNGLCSPIFFNSFDNGDNDKDKDLKSKVSHMLTMLA